MATQLNISNIDPNTSTIEKNQNKLQPKVTPTQVVPSQPVPQQPTYDRPMLSTLEALK